ncbi:hypothetical protein [Clostridium tagluense]|nr:hypothetical protein [Clostridium tagluense]
MEKTFDNIESCNCTIIHGGIVKKVRGYYSLDDDHIKQIFNQGL